MAEEEKNLDNEPKDKLVEIAPEEYSRLLKIEEDSKTMVPSSDLQRAEEEVQRLKNQVLQQDAQLKTLRSTSQGDPFQTAKELAEILSLSSKYEVSEFNISNFTNIKEVRIQFLEALKSKFGVDFMIDPNGDFTSQLFNLEKMIQSTNLFKQTDFFKDEENSKKPEMIRETATATALGGTK